MAKVYISSGMNRRNRRTITRTSIIIVLTVFIAVSCEPYGDYFAEYRGVNLLANGGFDTSTWTTEQDSSYLTYELIDATDAAAVGVPSGLDSATPVYRLEIVNLMPNGDFEDTSVAAGALSTASTNTWWLANTSTSGDASLIESAQAINGSRSLEFNLYPEDAVRFPLTGLSDGYVVPQSYYMRFAFYPFDAAGYSFIIDLAQTVPPPWEMTITAANQVFLLPDDFPKITSSFSSEAVTDEFQITKSLQHGIIDDVRVIPEGIPLALRADLPVEDATRPGELDLIPGTYRFTMYVHSDPSTALNRYDAEAITIRVSAPLTGHTAVFKPGSAESGSWDTWTKLSVTINDANIFMPDNPADPVISIQIVPTDDQLTGARDAGSLLIAHPVLEHLPDG